MQISALACISLLSAASACVERRGAEDRLVFDSAGTEIVEIRSLPSLTDPAWRWRTEVELEIPTQVGGLDVPPLVFAPAAMLPLSSDTLLVLDGQGDAPFVIVWTGGKEVVARFGRWGEGPEELSAFTSEIWLDVNGWINVFDRRNSKVLAYSRDGALRTSQRVAFTGGTLKSAVQGNSLGPLVGQWSTDPSGEARHDVFRVSSSDGSVNLVRRLPQTDFPWRIQSGRPLWAAMEGGIVTARSDKPVYQISDDAGVLVREIRLPFSKRHLTQDDIDDQVRRYGGIASRWDVGPVALTNELYAFGDSAFAMLQTDLWRAAEDPRIPDDQRIWRLVSVSGHWMGSFLASDDFYPMWIRGDVTWGVAHDSVGFSVIQRRRLIPPVALGR